MELFDKIKEETGIDLNDKRFKLKDVIFTYKLSEKANELIIEYAKSDSISNVMAAEIYSLMSFYQPMSYDFIEKHIDILDFNKLIESKKVDENFIEKHADKVKWYSFPMNSIALSEKFIEKYSDKLEWFYISRHQKLSENFIEKHKDDVDWIEISCCQVLSESFIEKHSDDVSWYNIAWFQFLSEDFIRRNFDKLDIQGLVKIQKFPIDLLNEDIISEYWGFIITKQVIDEKTMEKFLSFPTIAKYQKLSEEFMERHKDDIDWDYACEFQELSEEFIERNREYVNWECISRYQKLSESFIERNREFLYENLIEESMQYKSTDYKKKLILGSGKYECYDDYFITYKGIRKDRYSCFNFRYKYEKGGIYNSWCDCSNSKFSFGFNSGTYEAADNAIAFSDVGTMIVKCKVRYEDVGSYTEYLGIVRSFKIEILD